MESVIGVGEARERGFGLGDWAACLDEESGGDGGTGRRGRFLAIFVRCSTSVLTLGGLFRLGGVRFRWRQGREPRVE